MILLSSKLLNYSIWKRWQNCTLWQVLVCVSARATCQCVQCGSALKKQKMWVGKK